MGQRICEKNDFRLAIASKVSFYGIRQRYSTSGPRLFRCNIITRVGPITPEPPS